MPSIGSSRVTAGRTSPARWIGRNRSRRQNRVSRPGRCISSPTRRAARGSPRTRRRWRRVIDVASELKVLVVEGERGAGALSGSGAFLQLALAPPAEAGSPNKSSSYVMPELISDLELGNKVLADYRAIILCGVGSIQPAMADQLARFVQQGGTLMLFMGDAVTAENYNATLLPRKLLPGALTKRVTTAGDQEAYRFDFQPHGNLHPFLSIFRGADKPGIDTAQIFTYWQCDVPAVSKVERVLNYVPGEPASAGGKPDPAITVHELGDRRALFVSSTAN